MSAVSYNLCAWLGMRSETAEQHDTSAFRLTVISPMGSEMQDSLFNLKFQCHTCFSFGTTPQYGSQLCKLLQQAERLTRIKRYRNIGSTMSHYHDCTIHLLFLDTNAWISAMFIVVGPASHDQTSPSDTDFTSTLTPNGRSEKTFPSAEYIPVLRSSESTAALGSLPIEVGNRGCLTTFSERTIIMLHVMLAMLASCWRMYHRRPSK